MLTPLCFDECQPHVLKWYLQGYILEWGRVKCSHKAWHRKTCPPSLLWAQAFPPAAFWINITFYIVLLRKQCCCTASFKSAAIFFVTMLQEIFQSRWKISSQKSKGHWVNGSQIIIFSIDSGVYIIKRNLRLRQRSEHL